MGCTFDLGAAIDFMAAHARVLDRRRFDLVLGRADPEAVLAAVDAYRNSDGGYGHGLEPDLRAAESQPAGALHAFEVFEDVAPVTTPRARQLCDWLDTVTLPDGGLPFALPVGSSAGSAPLWSQADPTVSTLQSTAFVASVAHRVARRDSAVAAHPWLHRADTYCLAACEALADDREQAHRHAIELKFAIEFLDAVHDAYPQAPNLLERLGGHIPADGLLQVVGGREDEMMRPLDFAPYPDRHARQLFRPSVVAAELDRLAGMQRDDGGWEVDFTSYSPAAALEWRGYATVHAVSILHRRDANIDHPAMDRRSPTVQAGTETANDRDGPRGLRP